MKHCTPSNKRALLVLFAVWCVSASLTWTARAAAEATEERDQTWARARALFEQGTAAFDARNYEQARWALSESFRLRKSYDTAGLLGQTEIELGSFRDAAEHLDYCIREFPISENRELLKQVRDAFANVKQRVGTVRIVVDRPGAEVFVDDKPAGTSPLPGDVFVEPGVHQVAARIDGASPVTRAFRIKAGETERVKLNVGLPDDGLPETEATDAGNLSAGGAGIDSDVTRDSPSTDGRTKTWVVLGGAGLTLAAAALGIGFRLGADSADDAAVEKRAQLSDRFGTERCNSSGALGSALCNDIRSDIERRDRLAGISTVSFIAAAVLGAGSVGAYFLWPKQQNVVAITPARVGAGAEVQLALSF